MIKLPLNEPTPSPGQPENWIIGQEPWLLIARPLGRPLYHLLRSALVAGPSLLGSTGASARETPAAQADASLALVAPSRLQFRIEVNPYEHHLQPRISFELDGTLYDLPLTDPAWTTRIVRTLRSLERNRHP